MEIVNLKKTREYFDIIAEYHQKEWAHLYDGETLDGRKIRMQSYFSDDFVPSLFVAKNDNSIIGTASIKKYDLSTDEGFTPWMSSIFIFPKHRKKGYSKTLVKHLMEQAKLNDINKMYLYTEDADGLYAKLGWKTLSKRQCQGHDIIVMEAEL
jgi:GNAT superfamily N-acetyltransferase